MKTVAKDTKVNQAVTTRTTGAITRPHHIHDVTSSSSNAFDERYEAFFGTKGTLLVRNENEALLFEELRWAVSIGVDIAQALSRKLLAQGSHGRELLGIALVVLGVVLLLNG